jgi:Ala-tRNA(Pro) deacylase
MSTTKRLKQFLEENQVPYTHCTHRLAYTAQEVAAAQHVPGREMIKTIVVRTDHGFVLVVLPATMKIDIRGLRSQLPYKRVELATEKEFATLFPDSEVGAMVPFGNLYQLKVYVDRSVGASEYIVFNAGTHVETVRMKYRDFESLVRPQLVEVAVRLEMAS